MKKSIYMFISILVLAEFILRRKKHPEFRLFSGALRLPALSGMVWPISFQSFQLSIHWVIVPVPPRHLSASECWVSDELSGCISDGNLYCIGNLNSESIMLLVYAMARIYFNLATALKTEYRHWCLITGHYLTFYIMPSSIKINTDHAMVA